MKTIQFTTLLENIAANPRCATEYYNLYATDRLRIVDHKYPTYRLWKESHRRADQALSEVTLDHILPKSEYPLLTFMVENWQVMTQAENKAKGSDYSIQDITRVLGQL